ncbi:hypothetical protein [Arsenophonus sp.]|uniref:hypothetical protein n=1 Tax=Arsenophonus sp. TaxID=1872640 RepID=UPI003879FF35
MRYNSLIKILISKKDDDFLHDVSLAINTITGFPYMLGIPEIKRIEISKPAVIRLSLNEYERALLIKESIDKGIWDSKKESKEIIQYVNWHQESFDIKKISSGRKDSKKNSNHEKIIIPINLKIPSEKMKFIEEQIGLVKNEYGLDISKGDFIRFCIRALRKFMKLKEENTEKNKAMKAANFHGLDV